LVRYREVDLRHSYYSQREGLNPHADGFSLQSLIDVFVRVYQLLRIDGYFDEALGFSCVDLGDVPDRVRDVELEKLLSITKTNLWPIEEFVDKYAEDDLFDVMEFLYRHVSKPIDGQYHEYNDCGMHWDTFNQEEGRTHYRGKMNDVLGHYEKPFELSSTGEVLHRPEAGFEPIFDADVPSKDENVVSRIEAAVLRYRRHGSTIDDRRQAVRDLADVLEYLRPKVREFLTKKDEQDLFNLANNFGVRHHTDTQKTDYDAAL
jgi:hypothetical protein